jgi:pyruvate/2-oxoglutarate dehydrogenase complex dihydrolipoamide acyltransferase (E2) component
MTQGEDFEAYEKYFDEKTKGKLTDVTVTPLVALAQTEGLQHPEIIRENGRSQVKLKYEPAYDLMIDSSVPEEEKAQLFLSDYFMDYSLFRGLNPDKPVEPQYSEQLRALRRSAEEAAAPGKQQQVAAETEEPLKMVPLSEHPVYGPYFKKLKLGIPRQGVLNQMRSAGPPVDVKVLEMSPDTLYAEDIAEKARREQASAPKPAAAAAPAAAPAPAPAEVPARLAPAQVTGGRERAAATMPMQFTSLTRL